MEKITDDLIYLPDGVECPTGRVTFGAMIEAQLNKDKPVQERTKAEKRHAALYSQWLKAFARRLVNVYPPSHPIHSDIRFWEWHSCHFLVFTQHEECVQWFFNSITETDRRELCELSRK